MHYVTALFADAWNRTVYLADFDGALDISFALSLAYSILLKLGNFSGSSLDIWVFKEKIRVIPPLADNDKFNSPKFERTLDKCRDRFKAFFYFVNIFFAIWAIGVAGCDAVILLLLPFHPTYEVVGRVAFEYAGFLLGPLPAGLVLWLVTHWIARWRMSSHSGVGDTLIKFAQKKPEQKLEAARSELRKKLVAERDEHHH